MERKGDSFRVTPQQQPQRMHLNLRSSILILTEFGLRGILISTCMKFNTPNTMILYMLTVLVRTLNQMDGYVVIVYGYYNCILCKKYHPLNFPRWIKTAKKDIWDTLYGNQCPSTGLESPEYLHIHGDKT
jgi:hypothetical protein